MSEGWEGEREGRGKDGGSQVGEGDREKRRKGWDVGRGRGGM